MEKTFSSFISGAVIMPNGDIIPMVDGNHRSFFRNILKDEYQKLGIVTCNLNQEDNLAVLFDLLLNQFQILPYQGCTSGDRSFTSGTLYVNQLQNLTDKQLPATIVLYSSISKDYDMDICLSSTDGSDDSYLSLGEIYEELLNRPTKKL